MPAASSSLLPCCVQSDLSSSNVDLAAEALYQVQIIPDHFLHKLVKEGAQAKVNNRFQLNDQRTRNDVTRRGALIETLLYHAPLHY